ncbi:MAG: hypothetical protein EBR15_03610, partial [Gammaproteobacteria bacterium]|nr:hypothetical protein [Gammaproteobacteria bacterium]
SQLQARRARAALRAPVLLPDASPKALRQRLHAALPFALTGAQARVSEEIALEEIERELAASGPSGGDTVVKQDLLALGLREAREHFERAYLTQQLQLCNGKVGQLAKRVGMERTHLYRKLRALGVDFRAATDDGDG